MSDVVEPPVNRARGDPSRPLTTATPQTVQQPMDIATSNTQCASYLSALVFPLFQKHQFSMSVQILHFIHLWCEDLQISLETCCKNVIFSFEKLHGPPKWVRHGPRFSRVAHSEVGDGRNWQVRVISCSVPSWLFSLAPTIKMKKKNKNDMCIFWTPEGVHGVVRRGKAEPSKIGPRK